MALSLTYEKPRAYQSGDYPYTDAIVKASTTVYAGQVLATDAANHAGLVLPFDNAGTWTSPLLAGMCETTVVQGSSATKRTRIRQGGRIILAAITGADGIDDVTKTVYAANDDTFTLTSTNNVTFGKIVDYVAGEGFHVEFEAASVASI